MGLRGWEDFKVPEGTKVLTMDGPADPAARTPYPGQTSFLEPPEAVAVAKPPARYTRPAGDKMNGLEGRYAGHLDMLEAAGVVYGWDFEPEKFRLGNPGDRCYFTPDFRVQLADGTIEFHDTKGYMEEDAHIKIKWFVQAHPYPLVVVRWVKGAWTFERYEP